MCTTTDKEKEQKKGTVSNASHCPHYTLLLITDTVIMLKLFWPIQIQRGSKSMQYKCADTKMAHHATFKKVISFCQSWLQWLAQELELYTELKFLKIRTITDCQHSERNKNQIRTHKM